MKNQQHTTSGSRAGSFGLNYENIAEYRLQLPELPVTREYLEKRMGYPPGKVPSLYSEKIDFMLQEARDQTDIRVGYAELPSDDFRWKSQSISCCQVNFRTGKIIASQLQGSESGVLFAGTAGPVFDQWSKQLFDGGDFPGGYVVDFLGSEIVELAIDWLGMKIREKLDDRGWKMTSRFSPGYCGWNVGSSSNCSPCCLANFAGSP